MIIVIKRDGVPIGYIGSDIMAIQLVERLRARADRLNESYKYTYGELDDISYLLNNPVIY